MAKPRGAVFNNPEVLAQSWYVADRSSSLRAGEHRALTVGPKRLVLYRDEGGKAHVVERRCPHLGADLAAGCVVKEGLRCVYHHWVFGEGGKCVKAEGYAQAHRRRVRSYPVKEWLGLIWFFNGPEPTHPLEKPGDQSAFEEGWRTRLTPAQTIKCHPHLVIGNGLDVNHFRAVHGLRPTRPFGLTAVNEHVMQGDLACQPESRLNRLLSGSWNRPLEARFTTVGGSMAWMEMIHPIRFLVLFTGRPDGEGNCLTQTVVFLSSLRPDIVARTFGIMYGLVMDDRLMLEGLEFSGAFAAEDEVLRRYCSQVERLAVY